jgi:hypothetical protein
MLIHEGIGKDQDKAALMHGDHGNIQTAATGGIKEAGDNS